MTIWFFGHIDKTLILSMWPKCVVELPARAKHPYKYFLLAALLLFLENDAYLVHWWWLVAQGPQLARLQAQGRNPLKKKAEAQTDQKRAIKSS